MTTHNILDFETAPRFCRTADPANVMQGIRVSAEIIAAATGTGFKGKGGDVLLHSLTSGEEHLVTAETFTADYSRVLVNGSIVPLKKPAGIQLMEIREAEDGRHLKDFLAEKGMAVLDQGGAALDRLLTPLAESGAAKLDRFAQQGAELSRTARQKLEEVRQSPEVVQLKAIGQNVRNRLKKFAWGKLSK